MKPLSTFDFGRLVVKVGSSLLIDEQGDLDRSWLTGLAEDLAELYAKNKDLLVVSSAKEGGLHGAIVPFRVRVDCEK